MEGVGGFANDTVFGTYHWGPSCDNDSWTKGKYNQDYPNITDGQPRIDFSQDYHIFSVEWNTTSIRWFVDGNFYVRRDVDEPPGLFIPSWPLYTIFNVAIASWGGGPQPPSLENYPTYMYVDWIKVYQDSSSGMQGPVIRV